MYGRGASSSPPCAVAVTSSGASAKDTGNPSVRMHSPILASTASKAGGGAGSCASDSAIGRSQLAGPAGKERQWRVPPPNARC